MKHVIGILLIYIMSVLYSCKTANQIPIVQPVAVDTAKIMENDGNRKNPQANTTSLLPKQSNQWYSTRVSIQITSTEDDLSGFIVNKRDSLLYINIHKFGIELARVILTNDTITMVNRIEKTYYKGDYSISHKTYGISLTFDMIQSIFLGEAFSSFTSSMQSSFSTDSIISISIPRNVDSIHNIAVNQQLIIDKSSNRLVKNWMKDIQTQQVATISYQSYEPIDHFYFPSQYTIELPGMKVRLTTKNTKVNVPGPISLTIPQKYTPMFP